MKILDIINSIDSEALALPVFQRGYVWKRRQVKDMMNSLYHGYPNRLAANLDYPRRTG